jgi:hypothetical protein
MADSHIIVLFIFLSSGIAGLVEGAFPEAQAVSFFIHAVIIAILLFVWCGKHAKENGVRPPDGAKLLCGLLGLIGVPLYLFRTFGFKLGGYKFLLCLLVTLVTFGFYEVSFLLGNKYILF